MVIDFPPPLAPGDVIAVVAPSSPVPLDPFWRGLAWLRARYRLRLSPGALARHGYLAGDDERRLEELASAMLDPETKAVVVARGGYGAMRIVDRLPWSALARRPKWVVGFSDVTALHAMAWQGGVASVHGPNVTGLGRTPFVSTRSTWLASLERPTAERSWHALRVVHSGQAAGPIVGGNLALVHAMAAADRLRIPRGAVLALEDISEAPYRVDRMLTSLKLGGHLACAAAIVFGDFDECKSDGDGAQSIEEVLERCTRPLGIPVLAGAPFGHGAKNEAFVLGARVRVHGDTVSWEGPEPQRRN
jgi:muramoyltetrapeptide carboxypeptidase